MAQEAIVLYPAPGIGHIICMVELAKHILHHSPFSITILLTTGLSDHPSIHAYVHRISASHPSISFHRLPRLLIPTTATISPAAKAFDFIKRNAPNVTSTLAHIARSSTVRCFVIDLFCTSAYESASKLGIPVYYFFTSGAAVLALYSYFPIIHQQNNLSFKDMVGVELRAPGNSALKAVHMPQPILDRNDPAYWDMLFFCTHLNEASGIIVNTFQEVEPSAVQAIRDGACFPNPQSAPPVYYVGPFIAEPQQSASNGEYCLTWLDAQPSKSVVFLCFGSRGTFSISQLKEIAIGLERSEHRFLWVVKVPPQDEPNRTEEFDLGSVLPNGFIEKTKNRGLVVEQWAPQVEVMSRESVGGFVTHCGWNSVLEAVVAGVPMIAWPLYSEQHVNRPLMVEEMKVAIAVEEREDDGFVSAEEVERKVRELMESKELRERSLKVKEMALDALGDFGSSTKALANMVEKWRGVTS